MSKFKSAIGKLFALALIILVIGVGLFGYFLGSSGPGNNTSDISNQPETVTVTLSQGTTVSVISIVTKNTTYTMNTGPTLTLVELQIIVFQSKIVNATTCGREFIMVGPIYATTVYVLSTNNFTNSAFYVTTTTASDYLISYTTTIITSTSAATDTVINGTTVYGIVCT